MKVSGKVKLLCSGVMLRSGFIIYWQQQMIRVCGNELQISWKLIVYKWTVQILCEPLISISLWAVGEDIIITSSSHHWCLFNDLNRQNEERLVSFSHWWFDSVSLERKTFIFFISFDGVCVLSASWTRERLLLVHVVFMLICAYMACVIVEIWAQMMLHQTPPVSRSTFYRFYSHYCFQQWLSCSFRTVVTIFMLWFKWFQILGRWDVVSAVRLFNCSLRTDFFH